MSRIELVESATGAQPITGTRWRAKLIAADTWGSSAYYPAEVLERDGSTVFTAGLQMYQNHMTESEKWDRPEGSVENLVGRLETDAVYESDNPEGPGLYADVSFYPSYVERITEISRDVGLSVRAHGLTEEAEMDGRYGPVLLALIGAESVDVVTRAGAGGKLTSILESDRELAGRPVTKEGTSVTDVTKDDLEGIKTSLLEAINGIPAAIAESLKPVIEEGANKLEEAKVEADEDNEEEQDEVQIDQAAVLTAVAEAHLPAVVIAPVLADVKAGKTLEEAIKVQTDYRDSLVESAGESGNVVLEESNKPQGLAYAIEILG